MSTWFRQGFAIHVIREFFSDWPGYFRCEQVCLRRMICRGTTTASSPASVGVARFVRIETGVGQRGAFNLAAASDFAVQALRSAAVAQSACDEGGVAVD